MAKQVKMLAEIRNAKGLKRSPSASHFVQADYRIEKAVVTILQSLLTPLLV